MILVLLISFIFSAVTALMLIRYTYKNEDFGIDVVNSGPQKFHARPTPRIGGIAIFIGFLAGLSIMITKGVDIKFLGFLVLSSLPVFIGGLAEDITKKVNALKRLIMVFCGVTIGYFLLDIKLTRFDMPFIDALLNFGVFSLAFTLIAIGGVTNAMNIIDGYNGLSGMIAFMIFTSLGYVSFMVGDFLLLRINAVMAGAVMGFLIWNYPRGLIFAGDGGAYFMGFMIANVSVLLVNRHIEVSPWFPFLLVIYPVWETLFSIYRRRFLRGTKVGIPDAMHLHQLIYKRLLYWLTSSNGKRHITIRNSMVSPYLWAFSLLSMVPAVLFWRYTLILAFFVSVFIVIYIWLYWRIVRFKTPEWLIIRNHKN
ncbi:glycosyl transferase [Dissulfurispira thermophila]|uniref:Glycosyl transferase n=2 Tax=root TaxID=1 RepID=A0A7G1H219_9BACT|nr:glycosyltransferase [Dissulfurispira thermophila]BCB96279.1 glycosyl transferase [Dissulfurispira thermophila]